jgi:hypothetical protein
VAKSPARKRDFELDVVAAGLDGYSTADCVALLRQAALTAMRSSIDAADGTAADLAAARENAGPSLDPLQVQSLSEFAKVQLLVCVTRSIHILGPVPYIFSHSSRPNDGSRRCRLF